MNIRRARAALLAVGLALGLGACSVQNVDEAHVGVKYTDGWVEGKKFDGVIEPGGSHTVVNDHVYTLPTRQITWIMSNAEGADAPALTITAQGGEKMVMDVTVRGFLNTREETIKPFFLEICQKDRTRENGDVIGGCWDDADGAGPAGWVLMLRDAFGDPAIAVANDIGLGFDAEKLRYDTETKRSFSSEFARQFRTQQGRMVGNDEYFCGQDYDRTLTEDEKKDEEGEINPKWCPDLAVQVTGIRYEDPDLENIRSAQELAEQEEQLAVQEAETARAQQAAQNARATPGNLALMERQAMLDCASNPECQLTIVVNGSGTPINPTVPAG